MGALPEELLGTVLAVPRDERLAVVGDLFALDAEPRQLAVVAAPELELDVSPAAIAVVAVTTFSPASTAASYCDPGTTRHNEACNRPRW